MEYLIGIVIACQLYRMYRIYSNQVRVRQSLDREVKRQRKDAAMRDVFHAKNAVTLEIAMREHKKAVDEWLKTFETKQIINWRFVIEWTILVLLAIVIFGGVAWMFSQLIIIQW